jgi:hypothetical protein
MPWFDAMQLPRLDVMYLHRLGASVLNIMLSSPKANTRARCGCGRVREERFRDPTSGSWSFD